MKKRVSFRKDASQTKALVKAGRKATNTAVRASRALGLTITYIKDGIIYTEKDGSVVIKRELQENTKPPFKVEKGLVLHAK